MLKVLADRPVLLKTAFDLSVVMSLQRVPWSPTARPGEEGLLSRSALFAALPRHPRGGDLRLP